MLDNDILSDEDKKNTNLIFDENLVEEINNETFFEDVLGGDDNFFDVEKNPLLPEVENYLVWYREKCRQLGAYKNGAYSKKYLPEVENIINQCDFGHDSLMKAIDDLTTLLNKHQNMSKEHVDVIRALRVKLIYEKSNEITKKIDEELITPESKYIKEQYKLSKKLICQFLYKTNDAKYLHKFFSTDIRNMCIKIFNNKTYSIAEQVLRVQKKFVSEKYYDKIESRKIGLFGSDGGFSNIQRKRESYENNILKELFKSHIMYTAPKEPNFLVLKDKSLFTKDFKMKYAPAFVIIKNGEQEDTLHFIHYKTNDIENFRITGESIKEMCDELEIRYSNEDLEEKGILVITPENGLNQIHLDSINIFVDFLYNKPIKDKKTISDFNRVMQEAINYRDGKVDNKDKDSRIKINIEECHLIYRDELPVNLELEYRRNFEFNGYFYMILNRQEVKENKDALDKEDRQDYAFYFINPTSQTFNRIKLGDGLIKNMMKYLKIDSAQNIIFYDKVDIKIKLDLEQFNKINSCLGNKHFIDDNYTKFIDILLNAIDESKVLMGKNLIF